MKNLQWFILTALVTCCTPSRAFDSTGIVLANSLNQQMQINRNNLLQGTSYKNNYVLSIDLDKKATSEPINKKFNNGGEVFWKGMDETLINQKIVAAKESFGDIGYYVVVASIFKYANVDFDADQQQDWETIKNKQQSKGADINSPDESKNYFSKLIGYVSKELNIAQNGKYLINYYFTVFTYNAITNQYIISYKSYVVYSAESNLAGKLFPAFNKELINDFKADKNKWINKNIESDAAVIAQFNKDKQLTPTGANEYVINSSKDGKGHSSFTKEQLEALAKNMAHIKNAFGEKIKVYILNSCNADYEKIKAQALADPAANKIIITEDCDHHNIKMEHSFTVPQWIRDVLPDFTGECTDEYINIGLDALHQSMYYRSKNTADQALEEVEVVAYRFMFGALFCATSEEIVQQSGSTEQFIAGALHEVIATIDIAELIKGIIKIAQGMVSANIDSYQEFYNDVKQTFKDIKSGTPITNQQLVQRLMPPGLRNDVKIITTGLTISKQFANFYFTGCDNYQFKNGTAGPICPYRYGQVTVMVVPIILTGGEWAFAKASSMATELGSLVQKAAIIKVSEQTTADIINLLKDAEQTAKTVVQDVDKIIIKQEHKLIATIEKKGNYVKISKGEEGGGIVAGKAFDDLLSAMKADFPSTWKFNKIGDEAFEVLDGTGKKWGTVYKDKIVCPARIQIGTAGNPILNKATLVKNMRYEVDGIIYQSDELGRVLTTTADLDDIARVRLGNQQIRAVDVKDGVRGIDQGGHIIGARFFGPGEQINLYPQSANLNQGAWKTMENSWADAMVAGKDVKIEVEAVFSGASKRPDSFKVKYTIDGQPYQENFVNQ